MSEQGDTVPEKTTMSEQGNTVPEKTTMSEQGDTVPEKTTMSEQGDTVPEETTSAGSSTAKELTVGGDQQPTEAVHPHSPSLLVLGSNLLGFLNTLSVEEVNIDVTGGSDYYPCSDTSFITGIAQCAGGGGGTESIVGGQQKPTEADQTETPSYTSPLPSVLLVGFTTTPLPFKENVDADLLPKEADGYDNGLNSASLPAPIEEHFCPKPELTDDYLHPNPKGY